jgi:hypothetical protein
MTRQTHTPVEGREKRVRRVADGQGPLVGARLRKEGGPQGVIPRVGQNQVPRPTYVFPFYFSFPNLFFLLI